MERLLGVTLQELELVEGEGRGLRQRLKASDLFREFERKRYVIPAKAELRLARFAVVFAGARKARTFTIRPSNCAVLGRDEDATWLHPWMMEVGYIVKGNERKPYDVWNLELS